MIVYAIEYSVTYQTKPTAICFSKEFNCYLMKDYTIYNIYLIKNDDIKDFPDTISINKIKK